MFSALFDLDNPIIRFLSRLVDLVVLNVIFLISCIPVFTIGAALTSLYYVCINDWDPQNAHVFKKYIKSFRENFKKATAIWFIMLAAGMITGTNLWYVLSEWRDTGNETYRIGIVFCILILILYFCIFTYVWPLQAKFENKILKTIQNALGMAVAHLPETITAWCITGMALYCLYKYTVMMAVFLILLCSGVAYIQSALFRNVFRPYLETAEEEKVWSRETETETENRYADSKIELAEAKAAEEAEQMENVREEDTAGMEDASKENAGEEDAEKDSLS